MNKMTGDYTMEEECVLLDRVKMHIKFCKKNMCKGECIKQITLMEIRQYFIEFEIKQRLIHKRVIAHRY